MPDKFDPYREALVMETRTVWPENMARIDADRRARISAALHADPAQVTLLEYIRGHSGFCRQITVTESDLERVGS